jgi:L-methionine (R)-S-oxide reductase
MAEEIIIQSDNKEDRYKELLPQIDALISNEDNLIANLANVCAALKQGLNFFWVGFYLVNKDSLVLGPFQGPVACTRIGKGKGVCGQAWENKKTIVVEDVDKFPGHISCSSLSKSEIVLPVFDKNNTVIGVLDVDSDQLSAFDQTDARYLEQILRLLKPKFENE